MNMIKINYISIRNSIQRNIVFNNVRFFMISKTSLENINYTFYYEVSTLQRNEKYFKYMRKTY